MHKKPWGQLCSRQLLLGMGPAWSVTHVPGTLRWGKQVWLQIASWLGVGLVSASLLRAGVLSGFHPCRPCACCQFEFIWVRPVVSRDTVFPESSTTSEPINPLPPHSSLSLEGRDLMKTSGMELSLRFWYVPFTGWVFRFEVSVVLPIEVLYYWCCWPCLSNIKHSCHCPVKMLTGKTAAGSFHLS